MIVYTAAHLEKAYLNAIIDLHNNSIVNFVSGHSNNNLLVTKTITLKCF